jgi:bisphosphoglycerate-dependent phosphoglycerate mutase
MQTAHNQIKGWAVTLKKRGNNNIHSKYLLNKERLVELSVTATEPVRRTIQTKRHG